MLKDVQRQCPHLGGKRGKDGRVDYPSSRNFCFAKLTFRKTLLRVIVYPYAAIPIKQQREMCLWAYTKCPVYQREEARLARA